MVFVLDGVGRVSSAVSRYATRNIAWRLGIAGIVFLVMGYVAGPMIIARCTGVLEFALEFIAPQYSRPLRTVERNGNSEIVLDAVALVPIDIGDGQVIPMGQSLPARIDMLHALVPTVIFLTILAAYPMFEWRARTIALLLSVPVALVVLILTVPFHLVGLIEMGIQNFVVEHSLTRAAPLILNWMLFLESGGRWLIPIIAALGVGAVSQRDSHR